MQEENQFATEAPSAQQVQAIQAGFLACPVGKRRGYRYLDTPTQREFSVRVCEHWTDAGVPYEELFLEEFVPNGRFVECNDQGHVVRAWDEPVVLQLESSAGPNGLVRALRELNLDVSQMVRVGGGFGVGTIYHRTLEACATAIAQAINANQRYQYFRLQTAQEKVKAARQQAIDSHAYWCERKAESDQALRDGEGLFKGCHDALGRPLSKEYQVNILAYLNAPSLKGWRSIRSYLICGFTSLWQAWIAADPSAPRVDSRRYPAASLIRVAIGQAIEANQQKIKQHLAQTSPHGLRVISGSRS